MTISNKKVRFKLSKVLLFLGRKIKFLNYILVKDAYLSSVFTIRRLKYETSDIGEEFKKLEQNTHTEKKLKTSRKK